MFPVSIKQSLLTRFPEVKLSYDRVLHRKVPADIYFIVPKGAKAFLWFTQYLRHNYALLLLLDSKGSIKKVESVFLAYDSTLSLGTVVYGTVFEYNNNKHFCLLDMHWIEGVNVETNTLIDKLDHFHNLFTKLPRSHHANLTVGLPVIHDNYYHINKHAITLPYNVYGINAYSLNGRNGSIGTYFVKNTATSKAIFRVKATIEHDIYELSCSDKQKEITYGIAMISTYKHSVQMNSIFRYIRENNNLDLLEESEDEDEFENVNIDKFVNLNKSIVMECVYMHKFAKWCPEKIVNTDKLSQRANILILEKNL